MSYGFDKHGDSNKIFQAVGTRFRECESIPIIPRQPKDLAEHIVPSRIVNIEIATIGEGR